MTNKDLQDCYRGWCHEDVKYSDDNKKDSSFNFEAVKNLCKNKYGDIYSTSRIVPESIRDPFTDEAVPVYTVDELELAETLRTIDDEILETEDYLVSEPDGEERTRLRRDIKKLHEEYVRVDDELNALRTKNKRIKSKEEKLRKKERQKRVEKKKTKDAEKVEIEKHKAEEAEKRQKILDEVPAEIREHLDRLF